MARPRRSKSKKKDKTSAGLPTVWEEDRVILQVRESPTDTWAVAIETEAFSRFGASFHLDRECNVGQLVNLRFPPSIADRFFDRGGEPLSIVCLVQQSNPVVVDGVSRFHISVAFVGEQFPESYKADPLQSYAVCGSHENGFFKITESEKPFKTRRHPRFRLELEISLVHINKADKTVLRAAGFTKNVSVSGLSVVSTLEAQVGDKVKIGSADLDFYGIAVVRNRKSLVGVENLLHLELLDSVFPTRAYPLTVGKPYVSIVGKLRLTTMKTKVKMQRYTVKDFRKQFPNDDVCLEWLKDYLYPEGIFCNTCQQITKHHRVASRRSYSCQTCGHHVHPTAGTIYHKSSTPLTDWFYAVFLMASTRCGISAKQLERELGVTYKTAWRMFHQIRSMLDESDTKIGGSAQSVEIDETYIGGKGKKVRGRGATTKSVVVGAVKRQGSVIAKVTPNAKTETLIPFVTTNVETESTVYTDEWRSYKLLKYHGYKHKTCEHGAKAWVVGDAHTNSIEGFWSLLKGGIRGVYKGRVTRAYLQNYVNEFAFRYNRRFDYQPMFLSFLGQVRKADD